MEMRLKKDANGKLCYYSSYVTNGELVCVEEMDGGGEDAANFCIMHPVNGRVTVIITLYQIT